MDYLEGNYSKDFIEEKWRIKMSILRILIMMPEWGIMKMINCIFALIIIFLGALPFLDLDFIPLEGMTYNIAIMIIGGLMIIYNIKGAKRPRID